MDVNDVINLLEERVEKAKTQKAWAEDHGISQQYLCDVLNGRSPPGDSVLRALGIERVTTYRKRVR